MRFEELIGQVAFVRAAGCEDMGLMYIGQRGALPERVLNTLQVGDEVVNVVVAVTDWEQRYTKHGTPYLLLAISDGCDSMRGVVWDNQGSVERCQRVLTDHGTITICGEVGSFADVRQVTIRDLQPSNEESTALVPNAAMHYDVGREIEEMMGCYQCVHGHYQQLLGHGLAMYWGEFSKAPAAKTHHHAFNGGLLVHTAQLAKLVTFLLDQDDLISAMVDVLERAQHVINASFRRGEGKTGKAKAVDAVDWLYDVIGRVAKFSQSDCSVDRSLLLCATFFHDLGKIREYDYECRIGMNAEGKMVGHIPLGLELLDKVIVQAGLQPSDVVALRHIVASHHGRLDWGATVMPQTAEAWLFHFVDYVGSRVSE